MAVDKNKIIAEATRLAQKSQWDKAIKAYEKILAEDRKEVRILLKVGELQQKKGDNASAAATFNQVAEIYGEQGFFLKAVAVFKQIAKLTPDDVRVNEKLAGLYQQLGLLNDATTQLQAVATAYEKSGDQSRHLDVLRRLLDLDPENVVTCQRLGDLYARANRGPEALELYRRAASHLKENKRGDEWVKLAERIWQLTPDDLKLARELAQEYLARGDTKKALGKLQVCHGADKQDVDTLRLMAQAFRDLGQVSKTIAVYRALARVHAERGRRDEAALTWRMVLDLLPDDAEARDELAGSATPARAAPASAVVPAGRPPGVRPAVPPAPPAQARPAPARPPAAAPPAGAQPGEAGTPFPSPFAPPAAPPAPAPGAAPGSPPATLANVERVLTEVDVYVKYGLHQKALEHLQALLGSDPDNPDALERLRDVRDARGDRAGAAEAAERAVQALLSRGEEGRIDHAIERLRQLDPSHAEIAAAAEQAAGPLAAGAGDEALPPPDEGVEPAAVVPPGAAEPPAQEPEEQPAPLPPDEGPVPLRDDEMPASVAALVAAASEPFAPLGGPIELGTGADAAPPAPPADEVQEPVLEVPVELHDELPDVEVETELPPLPVDLDEGAAAGGAGDGPPATAAAEAFPGEPELVDEAIPLEVEPEAGLRATPTPPPLPVAARPAPVEAPVEPPVEEAEPVAVDVSHFEEEAPSAGTPPVEAESAAPAEPSTEEPAAAEPAAEAPRFPPHLAAELEEVEFYETQGLIEEALLAVRDLAEAHPGDPTVLAVLDRITTLATTEGGEPLPPSTSDAYPVAPPVAAAAADAPAPPAARPTGTTGIFDLGAELSAELGPEVAPTPSGEFQYSVADVFDQFKRGLERTVRPDDSATKYDLGIAFQEMGMLDEALEQFRSALAGGERKREVEILTMIGSCLGMKGEHREAIETYRQALRSGFLTGEGAKSLHFELGAAHEAVGEPGVALWYFQKIARGDPGYRGVGERVARLGGGPGTAPPEGGQPAPPPASPPPGDAPRASSRGTPKKGAS